MSIDRPIRVQLAGTAPLVGRTEELDQLERLLATARAGRPQLAIVRGAGGIGKTRLVQELARRHQSTLAVRVAQCSSQLAAPYAPFVLLLDHALSSGALRGGAARRAGQLVRQLTTARDASLREEASEPERARARVRLFLGLRDALVAMVGERATLIALEDVHAADPNTAAFLEFLALELAESLALPLLLVLTARSAEPTDRAIERLARAPHCVSLALGQLGELDVRELIRGYGIARPGRELVAALHEASHGNPLYIREVLRRLQSLDAFTERAGLIEARLSRKELRPPSDLVELIERRIEAVPAPVADVLRSAAVLGEEFQPSLLARVVHGDASAALAGALDADLLVERGERLAFAHALVRQVAYDQLPTARRHELHKRVAEELRGLDSGRDRTLEIAHHLLECGEEGDAATLEYLWAAGLQAHRAADWRSAIRCFEAAIALGRRLAAPAAQLGWLAYWGGCSHRDDYDAPRAVELLREAAAIGKSEGDVELWARSIRDEALHRLHTSSAAIRQHLDTSALDAALGAVDATRAELRISLLCASCTLRMMTLDSDAGLALGEEAVRLASLPSGAAQRANAESTLGMALLGIGAATRASEHLDRARRAAAECEDPELEAYSLARLALVLWMLGRTDAAELAAEQAGRGFDALRHRRGQCLVAAIRAALAVVHGDFQTAERLGLACEQLYQQSEYYFALLILYPALFEARSAVGDLESANALLETWRGTGQGGRVVSRLMSLVRRGRLDEARELLARDPRVLAAARVPSMMTAGNIASLAECAVALGDAKLARALEDAIASLRDPDVVLSSGSLRTLPWARGAIAELLGRGDEAKRQFERALDVAARAGALSEVGRAHLELGRLACADPGQMSDAAPHLRAARDVFEPLGMPAELAACNAQLERLPPELAVSGASPSRVLLMTDMVSSTEISLASGDATFLALVDAERAIVRRHLRARGGVEVDTTGDGVFAWFKDAAEAIRCALDIQAELASAVAAPGQPHLALHTGLCPGRPLERAGRLYGSAVSLCERLCKASSPGTVVVSSELLADLPPEIASERLGELRLKGFPDPIEAHTVRLVHSLH